MRFNELQCGLAGLQSLREGVQRENVGIDCVKCTMQVATPVEGHLICCLNEVAALNQFAAVSTPRGVQSAPGAPPDPALGEAALRSPVPHPGSQSPCDAGGLATLVIGLREEVGTPQIRRDSEPCEGEQDRGPPSWLQTST
jgi:hypothetical protein